VLGPILKKEITEGKEAILITVDVDEAPNVAEKFEVRLDLHR
jgi:thioredoxin-like negative regulator of GroEL